MRANPLPRIKPSRVARYLLIPGINALAVVLFWWLADLALERHLLSQAARQAQQIQQGWLWEFEHLSDLVGQSATRLVDLKIEQGRLTGSRSVETGFLSLNFRGRRLDARIYHLLQIKIRLSAATGLRIFHRETFGSAVLSSSSIPMRAGWTLLELDLEQLDWQSRTYENQVLAAGPVATTWGGDSGIVSSMRIHPAKRSGIKFEIDWIRLLPGPLGQRFKGPLIQLDQLDPAGLEIDLKSPAPLYQLPNRPISIEQALWFRDQLNRKIPMASLLPTGGADNLQLQPFDSRPTVLALVIAIIAGLTALIVTIATRNRTPGRAVTYFQLTGLLALGAVLLCWSEVEQLDSPTLAATLLTLASLVLALLWQARGLMSSGIASRSKASGDTFKFLLAASLPLLIVVVWNDQIALPSGIGLLQRFGNYLLWSTLQQLVLCMVLLSAMRRLRLPEQVAAVAAAVLFGLAHYPNFALMAATLVLAQLCLWLYQRHGSILPGIVLHASLGTLYLELMPVNLLRSGAIGERFFF